MASSSLLLSPQTSALYPHPSTPSPHRIRHPRSHDPLMEVPAGAGDGERQAGF